MLSGSIRMLELSRPWVILGLYCFFAMQEIWWIAVPLAFVTGLSGFVQMHDAIHNSLGLRPGANKIILSLSGLLLLKSGHALKVTHLRHHAQCLGEDDPEGEPSKWTLKEVFLNGPYHIFTLRFASLRIAPHTRAIQIVETIATLLILILFIFMYILTGSMAGLVYWAVAFILSALMPLWASYIPHRMSPKNPARLAGTRLSRMWTPLISSFAFHHLHHQFPGIPTALLPKAARELGDPDETH